MDNENIQFTGNNEKEIESWLETKDFKMARIRKSSMNDGSSCLFVREFGNMVPLFVKQGSYLSVTPESLLQVAERL